MGLSAHKAYNSAWCCTSIILRPLMMLWYFLEWAIKVDSEKNYA